MIAARARIGATVPAVLLLAGCISLGGETPDQLITLTAENAAPAGEIGSGRMSDAIVVLDPDTDQRIDVLRVPVQIDAANVAYLKDATWVEKPARQFRRLLAETIRARSGKVVVESSDFAVNGGTVISGRLVQMGYDAGVQAVIVRYDAIVETSEGTVRSRRFESEVVGIPAEASAVAPALNDAANEVAVEVADWIAN